MLPLVLLLERLLPAITAENEISTDEEEIRLLARLGSQKGQIEADEAVHEEWPPVGAIRASRREKGRAG